MREPPGPDTSNSAVSAARTTQAGAALPHVSDHDSFTRPTGRTVLDLVWPDVEGLAIDAVDVVGSAVWVDLRSRQETVTCPSCDVTASRVHIKYLRRLADRPLGGRRVLLRLRVRRFFCDNGPCSRRTMVEQVPSLTTRYRRRTTALARMVQAIGLAVGGRAGDFMASRPLPAPSTTHWLDARTPYATAGAPASPSANTT
ncbi:transposase family protein [Streptomyces sp. NPDC001118]|uniref:transposase family protein n=1 Tax=Streptomyces sp. CG4 TaxID=408783 RepID=UPI0034E1E4E5